MKRHITLVGAFAFVLVGALPIPTPPVAAQEQEEDLVEPVRRAIARGVKFLKAQQKGGDWEHRSVQGKPGGVTALALLALLQAGVPPEDEAIQDGLKYLRKLDFDSTYVVSLQTMVFALAKQEGDHERVGKGVDWLIKARKFDKQGNLLGWGYKSHLNETPDNSNTQYALLGLHEGYLAGVPIKAEVWESIRNFYMRSQLKSGGWNYKQGAGDATMTMSCAGLCGLLISSMDLRATNKECTPEQCGDYQEDGHITRALDWISARLPAENRLSDQQHLYYFLYGLERTGRLSGQRFIGGHDWYREGSRFLIASQRDDGSWKGAGEPGVPVVATSFSLLFLSKGRTPVLISKLAHGPRGNTDWNNDRNDARNLADYCGREIFKGTPLAWQVFDVRGGDDLTPRRIKELAAELMQSPILYLTGHKTPRLEGGVTDLLREYLTNGGFLLAESCCGKDAFDKGFRDLMREVFKDTDYKLEPLPDEHPIYKASGKFVSLPSHFNLEGVRMGCKWVVIYSRGTLKKSPNSLCCWWETNQFAEGRGKEAFQLGANIVAYATGLEPPKERGHHVDLPPDASGKKVSRGALAVAQLKHDGDWQPARKAMEVLMDEMSKEGIDVAPKPQPLALGDKDLPEYRFFYMHGRNAFNYDKDDLKDLRFNLKEGGGMLLADACCGSKNFDRAFRKLVADLFPDYKLEKIPLSDDLYGKELNGTPITKVRCRREAPGGKGPEKEFRDVDPYLEGIKIDGRWVLIYSKYDIGCALERHKSTDCLGHDHDSAVRLARAVTLYALKR
jgi:hypothetical protein